jgi:hypothetical protein
MMKVTRGSFWKTYQNGCRVRLMVAVSLGIALTNARARAERTSPDAHRSRDSQIRQSLLREHLRPFVSAAPFERYAPAVFGTVFLGLGISTIAADINEDPSQRSRWVAVGASAALSTLSFAAYAAPERYRRPVMASVLSGILIGSGATFIVSSNSTANTRWAFGSMIGAGLATETIVLLDTMLQEPISYLSLERDFLRLEVPGASEGALRQTERHLSLTARPIPAWVSPAIVGAGGLSAVAPVFKNGTPDDDRAVAALVGTCMFLIATTGLVAALSNADRGYAAYVRALHGVHLIPLGPSGSAGMNLVARF